jgi:fructoselysine-6-P-deglycase FrlB-like protein
MADVLGEIMSQPACWAEALAAADAHAAALPPPGARVAAVGCGTSYNVALAYAALRERAGNGETDAFAASQLPRGRAYDHYVLLSRSGMTTEVLEVADALRGTAPTTAICADPATPIAEKVDAAIALPYADEQAVVQTRFATTALLVLRASAGGPLVDGLPEQAARALEEPVPAAAVAAEQWTFLGDGWTVGLAHEAALKLREAAQAWTEAYPAMEYRHGPISITDERSHVWVFGPPPPGLLDEIRATGGSVTVSELDPLADLIRAQRLAVEIATRRGLDPSYPRHLSRSVVLGGATG